MIFNKEVRDEIEHKMDVALDSPEMLEGTDLTEQDLEAVILAARNGLSFAVFRKSVREFIADELRNAYEIVCSNLRLMNKAEKAAAFATMKAYKAAARTLETA